MYGLKYKYIRIKDQQLDFEMDIMFNYPKYQIKLDKFLAKSVKSSPEYLYTIKF